MVLNFTTKFSLSSFVNEVKKLSHDQRNAIKRTGFGFLLQMHSQNLSKNLLMELMERWSYQKQAFVLPPGEMKIALLDVAVILGLVVTGKSVVLEEDSPLSDLEKEYGATIEGRHIPVQYLERRLKSLHSVANEDFVRTFLLFTFGSFLFPNAVGTVNSRYLSLLEDLDKVPQFAWGQVVLKDLTGWMDKRKKHEEIQYMGGCLIFLQIWSYEHIDLARPRLLECSLTFPRACRWKNTGSRSRQWFTTKFQELQKNQITWKLQLTSDESTLVIVRNLLEMQNSHKKLPSTSQCSSACSIYDDDNLIDGMDKHIVELQDSEKLISKKPLEIEEDNMNIASIPTEPLNEVAIELEDSAIGITSKSLETLDIIDISSTPWCILKKDTTANEDYITTLRVLEEQNLKLRTEMEEQRKELDEQKKELDEQRKQMNEQKKVMDEERKEMDLLRKENRLLRNRVLSSKNFADHIERISLGEDVSGDD